MRDYVGAMARRRVEQPEDRSLRRCTKCGKVGPIGVDFYRTKPGTVNSRTYGCEMPRIECNRARCRGKSRTVEQRARDAERNRRPDVREQSRKRSADWYANGRGRRHMAEYSAKRYAERGDELRAENRARYHANPKLRKRIAEAQRAKRATPEGRAAHNASNAKYKTSERGRLVARMHAHLRRVRRDSTVCDLTDTQWLAMVDAYDGRCAYCGNAGRMTIDHIEPLSRGGAHTLSNVAPACWRCNLKKNA